MWIAVGVTSQRWTRKRTGGITTTYDTAVTTRTTSSAVTHHGRFVDDGSDVGNGVLLWFGEVTDFDGVVRRAAELDVPVVRQPHRNPPEGEGNDAIRTLTLVEKGGRTTLTYSMVFPSTEVRDRALQSGMTDGMAAGYDRLDAIMTAQSLT